MLPYVLTPGQPPAPAPRPEWNVHACGVLISALRSESDMKRLSESSVGIVLPGLCSESKAHDPPTLVKLPLVQLLGVPVPVAQCRTSYAYDGGNQPYGPS